jgi:hypothetical protein
MELPDFRTQYSKRYRNPDRSLTEEVFANSIHYQDETTGKWSEIDTTLVASGEADFAYATRSNRFKAYVAGATGQPNLLKITLDKTEVRLTPVGVGRGPGRITSNQASFSKILPDTDLIYAFESDAVKESLMIRSRAAARDSWRYKLDLQGLTAHKDTDGTIGLFDANGKRVLELRRPVVWDDAGATIAGTLDLQAEPGATFLDLKVDRTWLLAVQRKYPITIDPTISLPQQPFAGQDTFVSNNYPDTNWSDRFSLFTGNDTNLGRGRTRTFISYNLPVLPSGAFITSTALTLNENSGNQPAAYVDLYRVTSDWSAPTVTWNTQPSTAATRESTAYVSGTGPRNWDLTVLANDWYQGRQPNLGVMLRFADETLEHKEYDSSRSSTVSAWPKLTITYTVNEIGWEKFWGYAGNMNIANGNMLFSATDTDIPARGLSATVTRTYNSRSAANGAFGLGWSSELDMRLGIPVMPNGSPRGIVSYTDLDGTPHYFAQNPDGSYAGRWQPHVGDIRKRAAGILYGQTRLRCLPPPRFGYSAGRQQDLFLLYQR